jgi:hypothetical protein
VSYGHYGAFRYAGSRNGISVEIVWGTNDPCYDLVTGIAHTALEIHINDHGQEYVIHDEANERLLFPQEIGLLAELSGELEAVGWYGDYDLAQSLDYSPASRRMIALLQKKE